MDLLRLPSALRALLATPRLFSPLTPRCISTQAISSDFDKASSAELTAGNYDDLPVSLKPAPLVALNSETLNSYLIEKPPNSTQLRYASTFWTSAPPHLLFSAAHFRSFPPSPHPEVAFLGRSNVGKSSLLNALFGRTSEKVAYVSKKPGKTRTMNGYGVGGEGMGLAPASGEKEAAWKRFGRGGVVVVDMPGYGGGSREEWGEEALKYLEKRRQLRRTFVLLDAEHGAKASDLKLLNHLRKAGIAHTAIFSKVDKLLCPGPRSPSAANLSKRLVKLEEQCERFRASLDDGSASRREGVQSDVLCCSAEKSLDEHSGRRSKLGIDEVRWAVLTACGMECDESGQRRKMYAGDAHVIEQAG